MATKFKVLWKELRGTKSDWKEFFRYVIWPILKFAAIFGIYMLIITKCIGLILLVICFIPWLVQALKNGSNVK